MVKQLKCATFQSESEGWEVSKYYYLANSYILTFKAYRICHLVGIACGMVLKWRFVLVCEALVVIMVTAS
jgi:hypothetical protein